MRSVAARNLVIAITCALLVVPAAAGIAHAEDSARSAGKHRAGKRKKRRRGGFVGHSVAKRDLRTDPLPRPSGDIWIWVENFREELRVNIYNADGSFNQSALAKLDRAFRCRRTGEVRAVDPKLYELLSIISDHFDGKQIELTSGFRFQKNQGSRHFHASAMDIRVRGVSARELYRYATTLDTGNMGIGRYPRSGFVHVDLRAPGEPSYRWTDYRGKRRIRAARVLGA